MTIKYTFTILRPSKIYPNWDFGFENIPSGKPATKMYNSKIEYFIGSLTQIFVGSSHRTGLQLANKYIQVIKITISKSVTANCPALT
jgi:hypothetical protein